MIQVILVIAFGLSAVADVPPFVKSQQAPECKSQCSILIRNSSTETDESIDCDFVKDTYECEKRSRGLESYDQNIDTLDSDLKNQSCRQDQIRVDLTPYAYDHPLYEITLSLNISLTILDQSTRAAAIRLICLRSGMKEEFYCVNRSRPAHWDRFYWPCRLFDFSNVMQSSVVFPLRFHNDCFRLTPLSEFMLNVTLYPRSCIASYRFRMPTIRNVLAKDVTAWMPLVAVDTNSDDGVWISFSAPPPSIRVRRAVVELYEILSDGHGANDPSSDASRRVAGVRTMLRRRETVSLPDNGVFLVDLPKGVYSVLVHAEHSSCELDKCVPMSMAFNLTKDHYTHFAQRELDNKMRLEMARVPITAAVGGVVVAFIVIAIAVVIYLRRKYAKNKRRLLSMTWSQGWAEVGR